MNSWIVCKKCKGQGKNSRKLIKDSRQKSQKGVFQFKKNSGEDLTSINLKRHLYACKTCKGSGLIISEVPPLANKNLYPNLAIIGGGIAGVALAVACLHRGIPFTLYERDTNFEARSQGYGLTSVSYTHLTLPTILLV